MAARPLAQVEGVRQFRSAMRRAGDDLADFKDANGRVADYVTSRVIVAMPRKTGRLAATVRGSGTKTQAVVRAGRASVPYAGVITYGWPARHIKAQPVILDVAHGTEEHWTGLYLNAIQEIIDRIERQAHP